LDASAVGEQLLQIRLQFGQVGRIAADRINAALRQAAMV
jgi:hypothetical protein